jgi:hypothetical protein
MTVLSPSSGKLFDLKMIKRAHIVEHIYMEIYSNVYTNVVRYGTSNARDYDSLHPRLHLLE